jgi:hypothetical protein
MLASLGLCIRADTIPILLIDGGVVPYGPNNFLDNAYALP